MTHKKLMSKSYFHVHRVQYGTRGIEIQILARVETGVCACALGGWKRSAAAYIWPRRVENTRQNWAFMVVQKLMRIRVPGASNWVRMRSAKRAANCLVKDCDDVLGNTAVLKDQTVLGRQTTHIHPLCPELYCRCVGLDDKVKRMRSQTTRSTAP